MPDEIRPLPAPLDIRAAVEHELGKVPDGSRFAVVVHGELRDGRMVGRAAAMVNVGDGWSFAGYLEGESHRPPTVGAEARWSR